MSYSKEAAIAAQNAGTTAATIYAALAQTAGWDGFDPDIYNGIRQEVFNGTLSLAGVESVVELFEASDKSRSRGSRPSRSSNTENQTDPAKVQVRFGKYAGKTIEEIFDEDPDYLGWLADASNNEFVKKIAQEFLSTAPVVA